MPSPDTILGSDAVRRFESPGPVRRGLPAKAYNSRAFFDLECASLFPRHWTFVGFVHEFRKPGDAAPVTVGGRPVLLMRDGEGAINAFHNVCRHRCALLVAEAGNVGRFLTCPYHAWVYGLDGGLKRALHFGGLGEHAPDGFDPADHGLRPVRSAVLHDWIFVDLSGGAPAFEDYAAPLIRRLGGLDCDRYRAVATIDFGEVGANWKFLMENFIEPYHVQFVHATTTKQPLSDHDTFIDGVCLGSLVEIPEERKTRSGNGSASLDVSSRYLTLFPNFVLGVYRPDQLGVNLNVPLAPGRTRQKRVVYFDRETEVSDSLRETTKDLWTRVHGEDHAICERLQAGRASEVADEGGLLSPCWEDAVRRFQELVLEAVRG